MNKFIILFLTVSFMFSNTGCWDVKDITNRVFVTSVGLDTAPKGYRVTIEMPRPIKVKDRTDEIFFITQTAEAESISKAVSILQSDLSRDISFSHLRVLVIGESLARENNFNDLISFFTKNPEIALRFRLMFVDGGEAENVLKNMPLLDRSRSTELIELGEAGQDLGIARSKRFYDFLGDLRQTNGNALGTRITFKEMDGKTEISRSGGAIFTNWRLVGWLDSDEMQEANLILRQNPNAVVLARIEKGQYSCLIDTKNSKISPEIENGRLKFEVTIKAIGNIIEQHTSSLDLTKPQNTQRLEKVITDVLLQQASRAVTKSQEDIGVDYLGLDRALIKNEPNIYKNLDWQKVYPDVPVKIKVDFRISTVGIERR